MLKTDGQQGLCLVDFHVSNIYLSALPRLTFTVSLSGIKITQGCSMCQTEHSQIIRNITYIACSFKYQSSYIDTSIVDINSGPNAPVWT